MRNMQKFAVFALALPLCLAMPSVAFANTILTSKDYVDTNMVAYDQGTGDNDAYVGKTLVVNSSGNLELGTTGNVFFGTSNTGASNKPKEVTVSGLTKIIPGTVIVVTPDNTSSTSGSSLKVSGFDNDVYPMKYKGAALTTTTEPKVWLANTPTIWMFDGTAWNFVGQGQYNTNTTYSVFTGATSTAAGKSGLVKKPEIADIDKFLKGDGTWSDVSVDVSDKQTAPSSDVAAGKVLTYTGTDANEDVSASYIKVPVTASGAPSSNTVTGIAEIWIQ